MSGRFGVRSGGVTLAARGALAHLSAEERGLLEGRRPADEPTVRAAVHAILADVRARGDLALLEMARRFDAVELEALEVSVAACEAAAAALPPRLGEALRRADANIRAFHEAQVPPDVTVETEPGVRLTRRLVPLPRVGVYAPGGTAAYPSSVLMGVVAARAAGVREVVVCSPPGPDGLPPAPVLAAAWIGGASRLFAVGGAGAVAAMAFGTESVPRCDAVVGPGNRWVIEAKRQVAGEVLIDSPAGPSELLVVADEHADPEAVAAELLAQAEHDADAAVALVSTSAELLERVEEALARRLGSAPRAGVAAAALAARGALLRAESLADALAFADRYAPEHLALHTERAREDAARVRNAGTVFVGGASSVAFGDYLTGANHVLPTAGAARGWSGLSALTFLRSFTVQEITPAAAAALAEDTEALASAEGLPSHAAAARLRRGPDGGEGESAP